MGKEMRDGPSPPTLELEVEEKCGYVYYQRRGDASTIALKDLFAARVRVRCTV